MAGWLRRRGSGAAPAVYGRIVAQARETAFYRELGVPDSLEGRFEMLALHLFLVLHRLRREEGHAGCAALAQALVDHMVSDLDANLRELGAGDLGVGRRVKNMAAGLYGRIADYGAALEAPAPALEVALRRRVYGTAEAPEDRVATMAAYVRQCRDALARQGADDLARGAFEFPAGEFPVGEFPAGEFPAGPRTSGNR